MDAEMVITGIALMLGGIGVLVWLIRDWRRNRHG